MKQCLHCPWKVTTDPFDIPDGYCPTKHAALQNTIAEPGRFVPGDLRVMSCHLFPVGAEKPCVGWLHNQLGRGNNLGLRMAVVSGRMDADYELDGEQHETFEATLPDAQRSER